MFGEEEANFKADYLRKKGVRQQRKVQKSESESESDEVPDEPSMELPSRRARERAVQKAREEEEGPQMELPTRAGSRRPSAGSTYHPPQAVAQGGSARSSSARGYTIKHVKSRNKEEEPRKPSSEKLWKHLDNMNASSMAPPLGVEREPAPGDAEMEAPMVYRSKSRQHSGRTADRHAGHSMPSPGSRGAPATRVYRVRDDTESSESRKPGAEELYKHMSSMNSKRVHHTSGNEPEEDLEGWLPHQIAAQARRQPDGGGAGGDAQGGGGRGASGNGVAVQRPPGGLRHRESNESKKPDSEVLLKHLGSMNGGARIRNMSYDTSAPGPQAAVEVQKGVRRAAEESKASSGRHRRAEEQPGSKPSSEKLMRNLERQNQQSSMHAKEREAAAQGTQQGRDEGVFAYGRAERRSGRNGDDNMQSSVRSGRRSEEGARNDEGPAHAERSSSGAAGSGGAGFFASWTGRRAKKEGKEEEEELPSNEELLHKLNSIQRNAEFARQHKARAGSARSQAKDGAAKPAGGSQQTREQQQKRGNDARPSARRTSEGGAAPGGSNRASGSGARQSSGASDGAQPGTGAAPPPQPQPQPPPQPQQAQPKTAVQKLEEVAKEGHHKLLEYIYKEHPAGEGKTLSAAPTADNAKSLLKRALMHYHPDKQTGHTEEWINLCQEITRQLNLCYSVFK